MNTLKLLKLEVSEPNTFKPRNMLQQSSKYTGYLLFGLLILLWPVLRFLINGSDETVGYIDPNIWLLILISLITFMVVMDLCRWLLQQFWMSLGLPGLESMVLQFNDLSLWRKLAFYWLSFISLVMAAVGVLTAVL